MKIPLRILVFLFFVFIFSCKKASFTYSADAFLQTSVDTLHFNTIFTSSGSVSQFIKIINSNSRGIHISSIKLAGGNNSPFRINISGIKGPDAYNIDIAANDSAYIFVTASINPGLINVPFIVRDSIELVYNGNNKFIQLDALGQNAHFLKNKIVTVNETWNNDLPYVILGKLTIADNAILTINNGCHIYFHADAPFIINGSLQVLGNDSSRVIFTGDRLDEPYSNYPASYPGLIFTTTSKNNILNYAIIKNAYQAIVVADAVSSANKLTLNETIIDNAYDAGI
ncbi:MAG TPA: hypothetical protein VGO09_00055, partial [Flavisolibacter sp.]|nr:hypothetical protein [Flavisolibacter sp.]